MKLANALFDGVPPKVFVENADRLFADRLDMV